MIKRKTVLILGAGASKAYGFPLGSELQKIIRDIFRAGHFNQLLDDCNFTQDLIESFRDALYRWPPSMSIDAFLEGRLTDKERTLGKVLIALALLPNEQLNYLWDEWDCDRTMNVERPNAPGTNENWYALLARFLIENVSFEHFPDNMLDIITFNYDRSLEQYLYNAVETAYPGKSETQYRELLQSRRIIHVYGKLGPLLWQDVDSHIRYGQTPNAEMLLKAASNIKIMREAQTITEEFTQAHKVLGEADRICFLGFGFDETNLQRLMLPHLLRRDTHVQIHATTLHLPINRCNTIHKPELIGPYGITTYPTTIYDLLHNEVDLQD